MKIIIALSAAALVAVAPAVLARDVSSKTPDQHHKVFTKRAQVVSGGVPRHAVHAKSVKMGYPGAFGYASSEPKDYNVEGGRQAGGGGGGGGGSGM